MRRLLWALALALPLSAAAVPAEKLDGAIRPKLAHPYVWGASGLKAYDCSGFVWRTLLDAGVLLKRTTARKLFYSLPVASPAERFEPGTLVFFDQVHHVGLVRSEREFYHASTSRGTTSEQWSSYWQRLVSGYRKVLVR